MKPDKESKVLLIMDNHESHVTLETINNARDAGIVLFTYDIAAITGKTYPLAFTPMKIISSYFFI